MVLQARSMGLTGGLFGALSTVLDGKKVRAVGLAGWSFRFRASVRCGVVKRVATYSVPFAVADGHDARLTCANRA